MNKIFRRFRKGESGGYMLEAFIATPILLFMFLTILMTWLAFTNAMIAMNAIGVSSMHLSSISTWTYAQKYNCEKGLPGKPFKDGEVDPWRFCKAYQLARAPQAGGEMTVVSQESIPAVVQKLIACEVNEGGKEATDAGTVGLCPAAGSEDSLAELTPVCPGINSLTMAQLAAPIERTKENAYPQAIVGDCLNTPSSKFSKWYGYQDNNAGAIPLVLVVSYRQPFLPVCVLPEVCKTNNKQEYQVVRASVVYAQTRREGNKLD